MPDQTVFEIVPGYPSAPTAVTMSSISVTKTDSYYQIATELPGVSADDIVISLLDGVLTVGAKIKSESCCDVGEILVVNHQDSAVEQSFRLPDDINPDGLSAEFDGDVLNIFVGRKDLDIEFS